MTSVVKNPAAPESTPASFFDAAAKLAPVGYLAPLVIVVDQLIQVFVSVDGFEPAEPRTRFQFAASLAVRTAPLLLGFLIALATAMATGSQVALRVLQASAIGLAIVFGVAAVFLWLDGPTVKRGVGAEELSAFTSQWLRGQASSLVGCGFFTWLAAAPRWMR